MKLWSIKKSSFLTEIRDVEQNRTYLKIFMPVVACISVILHLENFLLLERNFASQMRVFGD